MTTTPNLLIDHIAASQAQKEVTANTAFDVLDKALLPANITLTDANLTLTDAQMIGNMALKFTGTLTAARTITAPARAKFIYVENGTSGGFAVSIKTPSGTAIAVGIGERSSSTVTERTFRLQRSLAQLLMILAAHSSANPARGQPLCAFR